MDSFAFIIFGITSNIAQKYAIPVLYDMTEKNLLPEDMVIIGNARSPMTKKEIEDYFRKVLNLENLHHKHEIKEEVFKKLADKIHYIDGHLDDPNFYPKLKEFIEMLTKGKNCPNKIYYLATYPDLYHHIFENLQKNEMNVQDEGWVKLMVEKPIGSDLQSAKKINQLLTKYFTEDQIFRIDHYLAKETLQNILAFRFANNIFEPLINKDYIDHIQITASEDYGIGKRGGYYDTTGALKDVGQNHLMQMLTFTTMDAPTEFTNRAVTDQRLKILKALVPYSNKVVYGQYKGYKAEENVDNASQTETFFALKTEIASDRFKGVPIYIRAGKKLNQTVTEISIIFKDQNNKLFKPLTGNMTPNILIYRIQPNEGIVLRILTKKPVHDMELEEEYMQFCYKLDPHEHTFPDPYEKLILDVFRGDQTFFNDAAEVEAQWEFIDPLIDSKQIVHEYEPGSWGPKEADKLLEEDGKKWLKPSIQFCRI